MRACAWCAATTILTRQPCPWTRFSLAKIIVLVGSAIPPAPAVPASTGISLRLKRVQEHRSRVNIIFYQCRHAVPHVQSRHAAQPIAAGRDRDSPSTCSASRVGLPTAAPPLPTAAPPLPTVAPPLPAYEPPLSTSEPPESEPGSDEPRVPSGIPDRATPSFSGAGCIAFEPSVSGAELGRLLLLSPRGDDTGTRGDQGGDRECWAVDLGSTFCGKNSVSVGSQSV